LRIIFLLLHLSKEIILNMKILLAPDSFKGTLSALEVTHILKKVFNMAGHECVELPLADGGEGTVETLLFELGGRKKYVMVQDPLGREIEAYYGLNNNTAYIEMAQPSGVTLLSYSERDPWVTSTFGLGQLIKDALDQGVKKLIIGIGGSATNDVGVGMAQALGVRFLDNDHQEIQYRKNKGYSAAILDQIQTIDFSEIDPRLQDCEITVLSDVQNPLYGINGASYIYAPQKGANDKLVHKLEQSVYKFSQLILKTYQKDLNFPGAGAAGGLGAGLRFFLKAYIRSGIDVLIDVLKIEKKIKAVDLVIVGEGCMDEQTAFGKAPVGIARLAHKNNKKVIAINGKIGKMADKNFDAGIDSIFGCYGDYEVDFSEVKKNAIINLEKLAQQIVPNFSKISNIYHQITILS